MIKTCFFDMGNVLVYFSHQKMCRNIAELADTSEDDVQRILLESGLQWQLERGELTEADFHTRMEIQLGRQVDFEALKHAAADIFRLNESIVPLLAELKSLGIRLVLLSNTSITHLDFIRKTFSVLDHFDAFTTSFDVGALKPHREIYEDAIRKAQCAPEHCFYIDDIEEYIRAAKSLGIHSEVYRDTPATRQALRNLGLPIAPDA